MKKQLSVSSDLGAVPFIVETVEDITALNQPLACLLAVYNSIVAEDKQVKKFADKATAAKRLLAVLPEYIEPAIEKPIAVTDPKASTSVKGILRSLFSTKLAFFTTEQLLEATGASYKVLHDDISRLKNPKYCGKDGVVEIIRYDGKYMTIETANCIDQCKDTPPC